MLSICADLFLWFGLCWVVLGLVVYFAIHPLLVIDYAVCVSTLVVVVSWLYGLV